MNTLDTPVADNKLIKITRLHSRLIRLRSTRLSSLVFHPAHSIDVHLNTWLILVITVRLLEIVWLQSHMIISSTGNSFEYQALLPSPLEIIFPLLCVKRVAKKGNDEQCVANKVVDDDYLEILKTYFLFKLQHQKWKYCNTVLPCVKCIIFIWIKLFLIRQLIYNLESWYCKFFSFL